MGFKDRLRRLERSAEGETVTLVCQECGEEFKTRLSVELDLVAYSWSVGHEKRGEEVYWQPPEDVLRIIRHPHSELSLVHKSTGERLFSWGKQNPEGHTEPVEDLSQP